tara:strand:- start:2797 stop:2961 length:165 start_codon:yes stop_codon:yes gene_type:complete
MVINGLALLGILIWMTGIVLAKGFWLTCLAITFAPYALYLFVEAARTSLHLFGY